MTRGYNNHTANRMMNRRDLVRDYSFKDDYSPRFSGDMPVRHERQPIFSDFGYLVLSMVLNPSEIDKLEGSLSSM